MENGDVIFASANARAKRRSISGWRKFAPSLTSVFLTCFFILALLMNGGFRPFVHRGFFCNDTSINYPVREDTVHFRWLLVMMLAIPSFIIKACDKRLSKIVNNIEFRPNGRAGLRKIRKKSDQTDQIDAEEEELMNEEVKRRSVFSEEGSDYEANKSENHRGGDDDTNVLSRIALNSDRLEYQRKGSLDDKKSRSTDQSSAFSHLQLFLFGFATTMFLTGIGKMAGGRLRPHFMQRCDPNVDCASSSNSNRYIEDFTCRNDLKPRELAYITTSWPSGHASISFYSMLYLIIYLNTMVPVIYKLSFRRAQRRLDPLVLYSVYVLMIGLACYISLTRVSDYHHHPLDVLSGLVIGNAIALIVAKIELRRQFENVTSLIS